MSSAEQPWTSGVDDQKEGTAKPPGQRSTTSGYVRLNVNVNNEAADAMRHIAKKRSVSITEVIRRAISFLFFVENELDRGNKIQVVEPDGHVREIVFM